MGLVPTLKTFVSGTAILASGVNQNFASIVAVVNGGIDNSNISQISAGKVTSGEFDPDRIPRLSEAKLPQAAQGFLKAKGATADPAYELVQWGDVQSKPAQSTRWPTWDEVTSKPATATRWPAWGEVTSKPTTATRWPTWGEVTSKPTTFPPEGHKHDAGDIDSGRLGLARLPTSTTANRFLKVGTANSTPAYSTVTWSDVQSKPSSYTPSAHSAALLTSGTVPIARIDTGATNNTQVAPGQAMTGSGDAQNPVGAIRLLTRSGADGNITAGATYSSNLYIPILSINNDGTQMVGLASQGRPPGTWQALNYTVGATAGANPLFLAVRIS